MIERDPLKTPLEGDLWDEGSGMNAFTHIVTVVGSKYVTYLFDGNKEHVVLVPTFRRYMKRYCSFGAFRPDLLPKNRAAKKGLAGR